MEQAFSDFDIAGDILDLYFPRTVFTVENEWLKLISQLIFFFSSPAGGRLASQVILALVPTDFFLFVGFLWILLTKFCGGGF